MCRNLDNGVQYSSLADIMVTALKSIIKGDNNNFFFHYSRDGSEMNWKGKNMSSIALYRVCV